MITGWVAIGSDMLDLGKQVLDKSLLDKDGQRAGKVDDLTLEVSTDANGVCQGEPEVVAIVTGPLALTRQWGKWVALARLGYWLLGVRDPHPIEVPWSNVDAIGVAVHLSLQRDDVAELCEPSRSAARRYIERIPGS